MKTVQPESKKHHFVPRSLLKYFRANEADDFVFVFNKENGRTFSASLMNAGSENGFNTVEEGMRKVNFEDDFQSVDGLLATRLRELHDARSVANLTVQQRRDWAELVAVQLLRTPIVRSTMSVTLDELNQEVFKNFGTELDMASFNDNDARRVARGLFQKREEAIAGLVTKDFVIFETSGETPFRISDRPVTLETSLPFGDAGLSSLGVAVHLPIGKNLLLGLYCPSIARSLRKAPLDMHCPSTVVLERLTALKTGLETGCIVRLDEQMVKLHNAHQIAGCTRFVYGPTENFEDARGLVETNPATRSVRSLLTVGKMGEGPAPQPKMPMGSWLVLLGSSEHYMLEVSGVNDAEPLEVTVKDEFALKQAMAHGPFIQMQYYVDKACRRGMREVRLAPVEGATNRVQVRHTDASLDALMSMLDMLPK